MQAGSDDEQGALPEPALLEALLGPMGAPIDAAQLAAACAQAAGAAALRPAEWLRQVLLHAGLKGAAPVQLAWRRFDQRRLPALVRHGTDWFLAERDAAGAIRLQDARGSTQVQPDEALQDALVLWLRPPPRTGGGVPEPLAGNLAARLVWRELFREPGWLAKVVIATVLVNLLAIPTSIFAMQVYDRVVPTLAYATLATLVAGMVLVLGLDWVLKTLRARILDSVSSSVDRRVSQHVFDHVLHLRLDQQPRSLGTLAAQVGGLDTVRQFFSSGVVFALADLPFALLFLVFVAIVGGAVAWVYALLLPAALLLGWFTQRRMRELLRLQTARSNERQGLLVDAIRGAESIRAGNAAWRFSAEWREITASIDGYNLRQKAIASISSVTTSSLATVAYIGAVVVGVMAIEAGHLTMGGLVASTILGGRIIAPIAQSVQYLTQWQLVAQSLQMVHRVLALAGERRPGQQLLLPDADPASLALDHVRFSHPESPVRQVDIGGLTLRAGERVLLLGPVGCGKSTLLKLMAGLYRPAEGRVRLGDADLWETDPQVVASHVGYLPQAVHLFKGTLRSNLMLSGTASDTRLLRVVRDLGIDAIAAGSPMGMDLPISEGGDGLSGGQRQLVALARVVIGAPRIWLLDEPTAALDGESEAQVWQVLQAVVQAQDILVVATHRPLQAARLATRVLVMQQGRLVQDGPPQTVLAQVMSRSAAPAAAPPRPVRAGGFDVV